MSRALMGARCPRAEAVGVATLAGGVSSSIREGFGSLAPQAGGPCMACCGA